MAIGWLAKITVLEGKNEAFEQTFLDLTEKMRANGTAASFMRSIRALAILRCTK